MKKLISIGLLVIGIIVFSSSIAYAFNYRDCTTMGAIEAHYGADGTVDMLEHGFVITGVCSDDFVMADSTILKRTVYLDGTETVDTIIPWGYGILAGDTWRDGWWSQFGVDGQFLENYHFYRFVYEVTYVNDSGALAHYTFDSGWIEGTDPVVTNPTFPSLPEGFTPEVRYEPLASGSNNVRDGDR